MVIRMQSAITELSGSTEELKTWINQIHLGDAAELMKAMPAGSIDLIVTSPPYWTAVEYDTITEQSSGDYDEYLKALLRVWEQSARVLRPNGKLAINSPIMPIPKEIFNHQHTRHVKNINNDIEMTILDAPVKSQAARKRETRVGSCTETPVLPATG